MSAREEAARLLLEEASRLSSQAVCIDMLYDEELRDLVGRLLKFLDETVPAAAALLAEAGEMEAVVRWLKETPGLRYVLGLFDGDSPESIIATVTRAIERGAHLQEAGDDD